MKTLSLIQGTQEWLEARSHCLTASEAPAMLGLSKYMQRAELLRQKATGIVPEVDEATQRRFDAGHASEAITRAWAENFIGEDLYPVTGTVEFDGGLPLLASFDGLTLDETIGWENKLWNASFAAEVRAGDVPDTHWPQLEHQMLVSGAKKVLFTVSDGAENIESLWYESIAERRAQVIAGWRQFVTDLANYQPETIVAEVIGHDPETLPALFVQVEGKVVASNMPAFRAAAAAFIDHLPKPPTPPIQEEKDESILAKYAQECDQYFADSERAVKACKESEENLSAVKRSAQAQAVTIDEVFRTIDDISERIRAARLGMDKLVKGEKENRRTEIVTKAREEFGRHWGDLCRRIGGEWIPALPYAYFADAIKGLKSLDSMRDKIGAALANAKIEANAIADRIQANKEACADCAHLFPDFGQVCQKDYNDFLNLMGARKAEADRREAERLEADRARIRTEEQARAERESLAKARAEQDARDAETARQRALEQDRMRQERATELARIEAEQKEAIRVALEAQRAEQEETKARNAEIHKAIINETAPAPDTDTGATMKLGEICERLGFTITAQFLAGIGFDPVGHERAAKLYRECDFRAICIALVKRITTLYQPTSKE